MSSNIDNIHIKRMDKATKAMNRIANMSLAGKDSEELRDCARDLRRSRNVLLYMFDTLDGEDTSDRQPVSIGKEVDHE